MTSKSPKVVETIVETLPRVDATSSYFIELDGVRLLVKQYKRGIHQKSWHLRATALPIGRYEVVGSRVVHRFSPDTVLAELTRHQRLARMQSPEFFAVAKQIAKRIGGRLEKFETDEGLWIGYAVKRKAKAKPLDLARLQTEFADQLAVIFATRHVGEFGDLVGIGFAERPLDLVPLWCARWDENVEAVLQMIDRACGARVIGLAHDLIELRLDRKPAKPAPIARAIYQLYEVEIETPAEAVHALNERHVGLWWD